MLSQNDYHQIKKNFLQELLLAEQGKQSSLSFIKHTLSPKPLIKTGIIQGIVIGGTNYKTETRELLPNGKTKLLKKTEGELPILHDKNIFQTFIQKHYYPKAQALGINFGFPILPKIGANNELDGIILRGTKEHAFKGLVGKQIGTIIKEIIKKNIPVAVANDTICLTLAGNGTENGSIIAGTGVNIGIKQNQYVQACHSCEGGNPENTIIINLEAGNFNKFSQSPILQRIDQASDTPTKQLFEKSISGKYLAEYFNKKAEHLGINYKELETSQELSHLSYEIKNAQANKLARELLQQSARLVACSLAALYEYSENPELVFIGEGSLLWKGWKYISTIQKQLKAFGIPKHVITIKHIPNSSIKGALGLIIPKN